jgi:hypothetical protein
MAGTDTERAEGETAEASVEARRTRPGGRDGVSREQDGSTRTGERRSDPAPLEGRDPDDAFPERVRRKYVVVENAPGQERSGARVYTDAHGEYLAFKDEGSRLSTRLEASAIARDMVAVAAHRGWEAVTVRGSEGFRREAWLEASTRSLEVAGYEPSRLDRAVLAKRRGEARTERAQDRSAAADHASSARREVGRTGSTVEAEQAGRARSDEAQRADRGGPEVATARPAETERDRWRLSAERFRTLARRDAVRDPLLAAAHSHVAALERALAARFPDDERVRRTVLDAARERVAEHLESGRAFRRAEIRAPERSDEVERTTRGVGRRDERERTQVRERGRDR